MSIDPDRLARAAITRRFRPGTAAVLRALATAPPAEVLSGLTTNDEWAALTTRAEDDLTQLASIGARLVCPGDDEWPVAVDVLGHIPTREGQPREPFALWVRGGGDLAKLCERAVSIVGSRASTEYGTYVASELAHGLACEGWCVVSGAAFGIDAAAHRGALLADGATVAVLANGIDIAYPGAHEGLLRRITDKGCVISEEAPGVPVRRERFLQRNRLIAALGKATVVVEAGLRSGALSTARHAERMLRDVLVVPGHVTSAMSAGSNELLRQDYARLVRNAQDVLAEVGPLAPMQMSFLPSTGRDLLELPERLVLDAFPARAGIDPSGLAQAAGMTVSAVTRSLRLLLEQGFVAVAEGGFALTTAARLPSGGAAT